MPQRLTRDRMLEVIRELPADASIADAIERLVFLARIEEGLDQLDRGETVPHDEVRRSLRLSDGIVTDIDSAFTPQVDGEIGQMFEGTASDADVWDSQVESDAAAGKLDAPVREAQRDHRAGRTKPL